MTDAQACEQLQASQDAKRLVTIYRNELLPGCTEGFVIAVSDKLCLLHYFRDFYRDGYCVFRLQDVTEIRSGEHEAFFTQRAVALGYAEPGGTSPDFEAPVDSWHSLLSAIQSNNLHVGLHAEAEKQRGMTVGKLISITNDKVALRAYSPLGEWHEEDAVYEMDEITFLQFGDRYIHAYQSLVEESGT